MLPRASVPLASTLLIAALAGAQTPSSSVLERSPNMAGGWLSDPGTIQFNFLHRFTESGAPQHQISNSPTFVVAGGLPLRTTAGFAYSTSSDVVPGRPNEWEFFGRAVPFAAGNPVADLSLQLGWNQGASSVDGELGLARRLGPIRFLAAGRTFSNAFDAGRRRAAVAGGTSVRLARYLAVGGDAASLLDRREGERMAWSASVQLGIPNAPHSFSLQATNTNTGTLEGASRGTPRTRYGFEYTVPITLARYIPALRPRPVTTSPSASAPAAGGGGAPGAAGAAGKDTVQAAMKQLAYEPARIEVKVGTTVVWTNNAPLAHTVTADDGSFDSGMIDVGKRWSYTFTRAGSYAFHCTPHPFMTGVVVVK